MTENKSDRPYLSLSETLCLIAYDIPEETGGSQWRRQQPGFINRAPKKPVADHLAEAHSKVIHEETRRFISARRSLENEMRRGTINPLGRHPHEGIRTVIPLVDRASLVIDVIGGFDGSGELHPDKVSFNDHHTWRDLLFPSDEVFAMWAPAGQETKPQMGRPTEQDEPHQPNGEQGQPSRGKQGQQRTRDVGAEALLINNMETVIAKAKGKWPDLEERPGVNQMARLLVVGEPNKKVSGYSEEAIRKILSGTYKPAKDRGIPGLGSG